MMRLYNGPVALDKNLVPRITHLQQAHGMHMSEEQAASDGQTARAEYATKRQNHCETSDEAKCTRGLFDKRCGAQPSSKRRTKNCAEPCPQHP